MCVLVNSVFLLVVLLMVVDLRVCCESAVSTDECKLDIVTRQEWGARVPKHTQTMANPVDTVVIHHTYTPPACHTQEECKKAMRSMQNFHMNDRGWDDIGYSFAIGLDRVFEGRGWHRVGAHAPPYNSRSIGISLIGNYTEELPSEAILCQCHQLINYGVLHGYISTDYQLIGHRQARDTDCPGDRLYDHIQTWSHWKS